MWLPSDLDAKIANLRGGGSGVALLVVTAGSFLTIGGQMIYPVLLSDLRVAYGLNLATAGLLLSVLWILNAFGQLPGGILADQFGEKKTLLGSALLTAFSIGFLIAGNSLVALFIATAVLGLSIGLFGVARYTMVLGLFPKRTGASIGVMVAGADAGQALLPPIASILAAILTWQFGFGFTIPLFVILIVSIWLWIPGRSTTKNQGHSSSDAVGLGRVLTSMRKRSIVLISLGFFLYMAIFITFTSFYPTYLVEVKGLTPQRAGLLFGSFFAIGIGMKPLAGAVYDRVGIRYTLLLIAGVAGLAWLVVPFIEGLGPLLLVTVFMAPILGTGAITQTYMLAGLSEDVQGTVLGIVRTGAMTLGGLLPTVVGSLAGRGFFDETFFGLAALAGCLVILATRLTPHEE